jgi:hypothetical protein
MGQGNDSQETTSESMRSQSEWNCVNECAFLRALTEVSRSHNIGIAGNAVLFVMEADDDERIYRCSDSGNLEFS